MAQCATTALAGAVPRPCVRGARGRFGGLGPVPGVVSLPFPPSRPACPALRVAGRPVWVSLTLARWYAIPRGLCVPCARSGCPSRSPRVPFACVCARAPPPLGGVVCAPRAVPVLGAGRAVPRGACPSACPAPVPCSVWCAWGGAVRSRFPPTWLLLRGASEVRRSPSPDCPPTGRAVGVRYPRAVGAGVWVWGPNTVPLACMPCGGCVPRGWCGGGASPGGVACHCCEGRVVSGAVPPPTARSLGGQPGPPTHWLWVRGGCGCGDPSPNPQSALFGAGFARCGGGGRAPGGGAPPAWVWGVRGWALSQPRVPAPWAGCRGPLPTGCGCRGMRVWRPVTNPTGRTPACCGGGKRVPGGGTSCLGVGRPGSGALPPQTARPLGGLQGPTTHMLWVWGGAGVGTRHQPHSARSCEPALCAVGAV